MGVSKADDGFDFSELTPLQIKALYRRFIMLGFKKEEAANIVAMLVGLGPSQKGWTIKEIIHLLFLTKITITS